MKLAWVARQPVTIRPGSSAIGIVGLLIGSVAVPLPQGRSCRIGYTVSPSLDRRSHVTQAFVLTGEEVPNVRKRC